MERIWANEHRGDCDDGGSGGEYLRRLNNYEKIHHNFYTQWAYGIRVKIIFQVFYCWSFLVKFASQFSLFASSTRLKLTSHFHFHFEAVWDRMEVINCKNGYESMRQFWYYGCFVSYVWRRTVSNTIVILSTIIPIIKINYCLVFLRFFPTIAYLFIPMLGTLTYA